MHPCMLTLAFVAAAECHDTVSGGLAVLCCTLLPLGELAGSYLASYDELLYICVHTLSISPTPTVGLALSWLTAFS